MRLNDTEGFYSPSFFNICLETNEDISIEEISLPSNEHYSTFIHEIIHYLQDIIFPYNIRLNFTNLQWFLFVRQYATVCGSVKRPFNIWEINDKAKITRSQYDYTFGDTNRFKDDSIWKKEFVDEPIVSDLIETEGRSFKLYKYVISINNRKYQLGALDLLEYIAYKIEAKHCSPGFVPPLPYKSIDLLFEHYGLSYISEDIRLCISEFCLYNDNPMQMLLEQFLKNDEFKKVSESLTYKKVSEKLLSYEFNTTDGKKENIADKHNRRIEE